MKRARGRGFARLAVALALVAACAVRKPKDDAEHVSAAPAAEAEAPARPPRVGEEAPDFVLTDLEGHGVRLAEFRGRIVVLEWFDPNCVFVETGHTGGELARLTRELASEGVVWLAINSTGPGKPSSSPERNRRFAQEHELSAKILLDPTGRVGRSFGATLSPEVFVIDENGALAYRGPADDAPFGKVKGGGAPTVYVEQVIDALREHRAPERVRAKVYGCAIKYARRDAP